MITKLYDTNPNLNNIKVPETRLKHCYMVAIVMEYIAKKYFHYDNEKSKELFLLGYIHDSMYDFEENEYLHNMLASNCIPDQYKQEIFYHSKIQSQYSSDALDILYFADSIVDGYGNICTFQERLQDILQRHGTNDGIYQDTIDIVNYLNTKELFRNIEKDVSSNIILKQTIIPYYQMSQAYKKAVFVNQSNIPEIFFYHFIKNSEKILQNSKYIQEILQYITLQFDFDKEEEK